MSFPQYFDTFNVLCTALVVISATTYTVQANCSAHSRSESRIVGGVNVTPTNKYPMLVALQRDDGRLECGGTILNKYYVVTSAACAIIIKDGPKSFYALAGLYYIGQPDSRYLQKNKIVNVSFHTGYLRNDRKGFFPNNIGVLEVYQPFIWNDYVTPTNFPSACWNEFESAGMPAFSVGWGLGKDKQPPYDPIRPLQEAELPLLTTEDCQRKLPERFTQDQLCVDPLGANGPCSGDYGSPLFLYNDATDKHIQIGIHSLIRSDCGKTDKIDPPVYTNVAKYVAWVDNELRGCLPKRKPKSL